MRAGPVYSVPVYLVPVYLVPVYLVPVYVPVYSSPSEIASTLPSWTRHATLSSVASRRTLADGWVGGWGSGGGGWVDRQKEI
jgi:hypothetical protein